MNKGVKIVMILIVVTVTGFVVYESRQSTGTYYEGEDVSQTAPPENIEIAYTLGEVMSHAKESDCWAAVNDSAYNLTGWIETHPGGVEAIISLCGTDGTESFKAQHEGQAPPEAALLRYRIGAYAR